MAAVAGSCLVLAGCGASAATPETPVASSSRDGPSISARMTCSEDEIQNAITITLGLKSHPPRSARWVRPVYTCTYQLQEGPLRLYVTEFGSDPAARQSFDAVKSRYAEDRVPVQTLEAFDFPAFLAADDVVLTVKDDKVLRVDASSLPRTLGPSHRTRRDLSYLVASAILRCWTGD